MISQDPLIEKMKEVRISSFRLSYFHHADVLQGVYKGQKVAVKSLLDDSHAAQSFLAEASVMT